METLNNSIRRFKHFDIPAFSNMRPTQKLDKHTKNVIKSFTLPGVEEGFKPLVSKVFNVVFTTNTKLTPKLVRESDESTLSVFMRPKFINFNKLDDSLIRTTISWILGMLNITDSDYYAIDDDLVLDILPNDSNAAYPTFKKKGSIQARTQLRDDLNTFWKTKWSEKLLLLRRNPSVIFHRFTPKIKKTNSTNVDYKIRQVWGIPFLIIFLECKYLYWFKNLFANKFSAFYTSGLRKEEVSNKIAKIRKKAMFEGKLVLCGDVSGFDMSVAPPFYSLFESLFATIKCDTFKGILQLLINYFTFTPFVNNKGYVDYTVGGSASGNYLTSTFNSFVTLFVVTYNFVRVNGKLPEEGDFLIQGDDFIMLIPNKECFASIKENFMDFNLRIKLYDGAIVNHDDDIEFLGFFWDHLCEPDQSDKWLIARIIYPENYVEMGGPERVISRYLSLIFQLKRYRHLFKIFYENDHYLRRIMHSRDVFNLRIIDNSGRLTNNVLPLNLFLTKGWRAF